MIHVELPPSATRRNRGTLRAGFCAVIAALVHLCGCAGAPPLLPPAIPADGAAHLTPTTTTWDEALREVTRRTEPYDAAVRVADLRAALLTPRVRKAFLDERARFHGRFADKAQRELVGMGSADEGVDAQTTLAGPQGEEQVLVFVAFYVSDQKHRELSTHTTVWDTALVRGGKRVKPIAIENIRYSPAVVEVFPFVDRFDDLYLFRFPLVDAATGVEVLAPSREPLVFEARSALADCVVSWTLVE